MEKRFLLFLLLATGLLFLNTALMQWLQKNRAAKDPAVAEGEVDPGAVQPVDPNAPADPDKPRPEVGKPAVAENEPVDPQPPAIAANNAVDPKPETPTACVTLGSVDPRGKYRMAATLTNRGAAIETIELASENMRDLEEASGYFGYLSPVAAPNAVGAQVRAVAEGCPAQKAGLKPGDIITQIGETKIEGPDDLRIALRPTRPGQNIAIQFIRDDQPQPVVTATVARHPLKVVRPEGRDPLSLLLTLARLGQQTIPRETGLTTRDAESAGAVVTKIAADSPAERALLKVGDVITQFDGRKMHDDAELSAAFAKMPVGTQASLTVQRGDLEVKLSLAMEAEIPGLTLRTGNWEILEATQDHATFRWVLASGLELLKTYQLAQVDPSGRDYHLTLKIQIRNKGTEAIDVAYQLDGPTGLPIEGWWYANKVSREGYIFPGAIGVRDVAVRFEGFEPLLQPCTSLLGEGDVLAWDSKKLWLEYLGVDAQYFAAALVPQRQGGKDIWFDSAMPLRVGPIPDDRAKSKLTNISSRLESTTHKLEPNGPPIEHEFVFFAGPKQPDLLAKYGLGELVYYGWFWWVAKPMLWLLESFYSLVGNYGLAIIMLTVVVRACMFPLSKKQAMSAQKMQELQPEIKRIAEKYKNDPMEKQKATSELFKKNNFRPLGGCLLVFVQLPIFMGLYRSLMVGVQLRQAPLIPGIDWASNLAAPDMLFRWDALLPAFLASETGWLGPYFNVFPLITIALFLVQQKMFMPPPADEQAELQQKMMKYMMVFMGFMFFKVPAGLCIYFIASSLWGIAERKLLPRLTGQTHPQKKTESGPVDSKPAAVRSNGKPRGGKDKVKRKR